MENDRLQNSPDTAKIMSVKDWLITLLINAIPFVGFIMLIVWAFGSETNPNQSNWAKAMLIFLAIGIALGIFFLIVFGGIFLASLDEIRELV